MLILAHFRQQNQIQSLPRHLLEYLNSKRFYSNLHLFQVIIFFGNLSIL